MYSSILMFQHVQLFERLNRKLSFVGIRAFFVNCLLLEERTYSMVQLRIVNRVPDIITKAPQ